MIRKSLIFAFLFIGIAIEAISADCVVPQLTIQGNPRVYYTDDQIYIRATHTKGAYIEFKFEYRSITTDLFGPDKPYQTDYNTKVTDISKQDIFTDGRITESTTTGHWKGYARAKCMLGEPNPKQPQQTYVTDWSAPIEFVFLDKGSDGIFATVKTDPASYTGACPKTVLAYARIRSFFKNNTVNYSWQLSGGKTSPGGTLSFSTPGVQDTASIGFPVGVTGSGTYTDPPHSGLIYLIINGKKALPLPGAGYQVNCIEKKSLDLKRKINVPDKNIRKAP